jgi:hypothetical protein
VLGIVSNTKNFHKGIEVGTNREARERREGNEERNIREGKRGDNESRTESREVLLERFSHFVYLDPLFVECVPAN